MSPETPSDPVHLVEQYETWQRETIRRHGWALQAVAGDEEGPPFVYTVGLSGFDHPELIVFAVSHATAAVLLNRLGAAVRAGRRFGPGDVFALPEGAVSVLDFPASAQWLLGAQRLYRAAGGPPVPALLLVPEGDHEEGAGEDPPCTACP